MLNEDKRNRRTARSLNTPINLISLFLMGEMVWLDCWRALGRPREQSSAPDSGAAAVPLVVELDEVVFGLVFGELARLGAGTAAPQREDKPKQTNTTIPIQQN